MGHYNLQTDVGTLAVIDFHGQPAIGGVKLVVECEMRWAEDAASRRPQVMVTGGVLKVVGESLGNRDLGFAFPYSPHLLEPSKKIRNPRFSLDLECSRAFVRELNSLRGSGGMRVSAAVAGWVLLTTSDPVPDEPRDAFVIAPPQDVRPSEHQQASRQSLTSKRLFSFLATASEFQVDAGKWLQVLAQGGFMKSMLIEVPLPERGDASGLGEVAAALERTVAIHRQGDFLSKEAVGSLRDVLDGLEQWRPELKMTDREARDYVETYRRNGGAPREMRVRHLLWSIRRLTDLAHHGKPIWKPHDAEYVITALAAFIRRLVEDLPIRNAVP